jgi:hypothetical protein
VRIWLARRNCQRVSMMLLTNAASRRVHGKIGIKAMKPRWGRRQRDFSAQIHPVEAFGRCGNFCGNGRWRVVDQPLTHVRGQASLPFSWARHLPPRPGVRSGLRNIPASNWRSAWQPFRGTFDAQNCDQPGGVGSAVVRTAAVITTPRAILARRWYALDESHGQADEVEFDVNLLQRGLQEDYWLRRCAGTMNP